MEASMKSSTKKNKDGFSRNISNIDLAIENVEPKER